MPKYSDEKRQAILNKLLPPHGLTPKEVAEQERVSLATVYKMRKEARARGECFPGEAAPEGWTSRDKFAAVVESAALNTEERAEYCRRRGIYPEQLEQWRADCEQAADRADDHRANQEAELRVQRKRVKALEQELQRKESALAETAALLTLSKKAAAIWGESEDA